MKTSPQLNEKLKELLKTSKKLQDEKLVAGPGGNTSIRVDGTMWISPSGIPFKEMTIKDFVPVDLQSGMIPSNEKLMPSSEVPIHLSLYNIREEISCIIHSHPPNAIALSTVSVPLVPLFPDHVIYLGELVPYADYTTPCTEEMAIVVTRAIGKHPSCIIKNHGVVTVGKSIKEAYTRTVVLEAAAEIFIKAKSIGNPRALTHEECLEILNLDIEKYRQKLLLGTD